jgi:hypothetical protein
MEGEKIPNKVLNGKFHKRIQVGIPRIIWKYVVRRDTLQTLGIRGWRRRAENREKRRKGGRLGRRKGCGAPYMDG